MKFKPAKSCFIVVMRSAGTFLLPVMFHSLRIELNDFDEIIFNGWCTFLILLNPSLDSSVEMLCLERSHGSFEKHLQVSELVHAAVHDNQNNLFVRNFPIVLMLNIYAWLMKIERTGPKRVAIANKIKEQKGHFVNKWLNLMNTQRLKRSKYLNLFWILLKNFASTFF